MSLRQGNLAGAIGLAHVDTPVHVCRQTVQIGGWPERSVTVLKSAHVCLDSEMACDGQGKTKRISPVCLRERNSHVRNTHREKSVSSTDFMCVCLDMRGVGQASGWFCVSWCVCVFQGHRPRGHLLHYGLARQAKATLTHCMT